MASITSALSDFLKDEVLANYDLDRLDTLRQYIANREGQNEDATSAFCDFLDLGGWFYEALTREDVSIESLLDEMESTLAREASEDARDRAEVDADLRRMQGATV